MSITPEHVGDMTAGITPVQIVILIFLGILILIGIINLVKWMIDIKIGTIPNDIKNINDDIKQLNDTVSEKLNNLDKSVIEITSKLWSKGDIEKEIESAINKHILECPLRNQNPKS